MSSTDARPRGSPFWPPRWSSRSAQEPAVAQDCKEMRKINVGVSVAPPNVVHTAPTHRQASSASSPSAASTPTSCSSKAASRRPPTAAAAQGSAIVSVSDVAVGNGMKVQQFWGLAPRMPQAYMVSPDIKTAADLKGKRLSATGGGVGGFNWRMGREVLKTGEARGRRRAVHLVADRRPAARPGRRPDRRRRAASGGRLPRQEAEADAATRWCSSPT